MSTETPRPASAADRDTANVGQQLLAAFDAVADVPLAQREAAIQALGLECPELERELRALLDRDAETGPLDASLSGQIQPLLREALPELDPAPAQIGPYAVLRLLGEGGMGRVYLARRSDGPVAREVAIKLIRPDRAGAGLLARFEAERRHLAALDHPGICRFIDADSLADGTPYVVMEAVEGEPIIDYCQRHSLGLRARVELLRKLLAAVAHAHDRLLLHRDIKPHNVLVTAEGQPKLLDFGIAKSIEDAEASVTRTAERFFTPNASPPEQLLGQPAGMASDVYSLGALAYELLSGALPFEFKDLRAAEIERLILQVAPPLMSERSALPWARELKGDLDAIVATCLRKAPTERYRNVDALDAELQRWLEGRPVTARAPSWAYRSRLFIRRHRVAVGLSAALVAAIAVFGSGLALQAIELREQRNLAVIERDRALQVVEILESAFRNADPGRTAGDKVTARQILDAAGPSIDALEASQPGVFARLAATLGRVELDLNQGQRATNWISRGLKAAESANSSNEVTSELLFAGVLNHARGGEPKHAEEMLTRLEEMGLSERPEFILGKARTLVTRTKNLEAVEFLNRKFSGDPELISDPKSQTSNDLRWLSAFALGRTGDIAAAIRQFREIESWQALELPTKHPWLLQTRLAMLSHQSLMQPSASLVEEQRLLISELDSTYGSLSMASAIGRRVLAKQLSSLGRLNEALPEMRFAHEATILNHGHNHVDSVRASLDFGGLLMRSDSLSDRREAIEILGATLEISRRNYGAKAPITAHGLTLLANSHLSVGNDRQALAVLVDAQGDELHKARSIDNIRNRSILLGQALRSALCVEKKEETDNCEIAASIKLRLDQELVEREQSATNGN